MTPFPFRVARGSRPVWSAYLFFCFLIIVGVRVFLVERFGASIGWGDDIDGILQRLLVPFHRGTLHWSALFTPHNGDHVITATRLWEIFWYVVNGEWDPKLVMIAKVPVFAAAMTIFTHLLTRGLERGRFAAGALLTLLFAFPFNFHALLWAFQSQFDFFLLTAALGWWALLNDRPILALLIAAVSPLTLGAGPILAASYVPYWIGRRIIGPDVPGGATEPNDRRATGAGFFAPLRMTNREVDRDSSWPRLAACCLVAIAIAAVGYSLRTPEAMPHAGTVGDKVATFFKLYAWPFSNLLSAVERLPESSSMIPGPLFNFPSAETSWILALADAIHRHPGLVVLINLVTALILFAPTGVVLGLVVMRRLAWRVVAGPVALTGFVALMITATAVARADQPTIAIRFVDHVMLAGLVALVAAVILVGRDRRWIPWVGLWGLVLGFGYLATAGATLSQMVNRRKPQVSLEILQHYYAGDRAALMDREALKLFIVSDDPTALMRQLDDPDVRALMPKVITEPGSAPQPVAAAASDLAQWGLVLAGFAAAAASWLALRGRQTVREVGAAMVSPA